MKLVYIKENLEEKLEKNSEIIYNPITKRMHSE